MFGGSIDAKLSIDGVSSRGVQLVGERFNPDLLPENRLAKKGMAVRGWWGEEGPAKGEIFQREFSRFPLALMKDPCSDFALLSLSLSFFSYQPGSYIHGSFRTPKGHAGSLINVLSSWTTTFLEERKQPVNVSRVIDARDNESGIIRSHDRVSVPVSRGNSP